MNTSLVELPGLNVGTNKNTHIHTSPYEGEVDFSPLENHASNSAALDLVSLADLLRNAFVYPPHTIYRDVKAIATGFDFQRDVDGELRFHFAYQSAFAKSRPAPGTISDQSLLHIYHSLLVEAVQRSTANISTPWFLQSGGKDSTSLAIAISNVRPDTTCITYLGGAEENEIDSARFVARELGLRHEALVCRPGRAYDRYLAMVPRMPLLTADFAMLSYADLATEIQAQHGDGIIDALGVDQYFGVPLHLKDRALRLLARNVRMPSALLNNPAVRRSFRLCFALGTLQMNPFERLFPGSRFSNSEVDELFGWNVSTYSRDRMKAFHDDIKAAQTAEAVRRMALVVTESAAVAKGMYAAKAADLRIAYPYCDKPLCEWIFHNVPDDRLIGPGGVNKVLMRQYIAQHFQHLPYVKSKGSFRFDLYGLAKQRYDQVHAFAVQARAVLPGAVKWLEAHRRSFDNKYFASKFYLLAVTLPWLLSRMNTTNAARETTAFAEENSDAA